jgi:hypothetical protein
VGTTTLATALRGYDQGRAVDHGVDVLVCRSTGASLHAAATAIARLVAAGRRGPVLAVTADLPAPVRGPLRARLRMIEPQVSGLVLVPYVARWRELTDPLSEAARLSGHPVEQLPRALRGYGGAIARLAEAVLHSGLLQSTHDGQPTGPAVNRTTGPVPTGTGPLPAGTGPLPAGTGPLRTGTNSGIGLDRHQPAAPSGGLELSFDLSAAPALHGGV